MKEAEASSSAVSRRARKHAPSVVKLGKPASRARLPASAPWRSTWRRWSSTDNAEAIANTATRARSRERALEAEQHPCSRSSSTKPTCRRCSTRFAVRRAGPDGGGGALVQARRESQPAAPRRDAPSGWAPHYTSAPRAGGRVGASGVARTAASARSRLRRRRARRRGGGGARAGGRGRRSSAARLTVGPAAAKSGPRAAASAREAHPPGAQLLKRAPSGPTRDAADRRRQRLLLISDAVKGVDVLRAARSRRRRGERTTRARALTRRRTSPPLRCANKVADATASRRWTPSRSSRRAATAPWRSRRDVVLTVESLLDADIAAFVRGVVALLEPGANAPGGQPLDFPLLDA